jgi:5-methylcytosine-specific restriction endonuclease McrA
MTPKPPGRTGAEWWRMRSIVLAEEKHCHICQQPIDFDAPPKTRWAPSVDHLRPVSRTKHLDPAEQRRLALDRNNLRACHFGCNSRRRDRPVPQSPSRRPKLTSTEDLETIPLPWSRVWFTPIPDRVVLDPVIDPRIPKGSNQ